MNEIVLPKIKHANVTLNERNRVVIKMDEGWRFWKRGDYLDENGEMREPTPAELVCARYGTYSPLTDFDNFVVIAESEIPVISEEPETPPVIPEEPEVETLATEDDYINALKELGVTFDE